MGDWLQLQIEMSSDDSGLDRIDVVLRFFGSVHAFTAYQEVFFEGDQFPSIRDHAQVVPLKVEVAGMSQPILKPEDRPPEALPLGAKVTECLSKDFLVHVPPVADAARNSQVSFGANFESAIRIGEARVARLVLHGPVTEQPLRALSCNIHVRKLVFRTAGTGRPSPKSELLVLSGTV
jgi:hypothetical protein